MGRYWGAEAGIFPISDSSGLILSQACRKGRKRVLQAKFHHQRQPQQKEEEAWGKQTVGAGADRGVVWKRGKLALSLGLPTTLALLREGLRPSGVHTRAHVCAHMGAGGTRAYLFRKWQ